MTGRPAYLGIDWGSTNRRIFAISEEGHVVTRIGDAAGALALSPQDYGSSIDDVRARLGPLPILAAGMVGSNRGWVDAPYVDCPAGLDDLASALVAAPASNVRIVPGVARRDRTRPDVMRGEEIQILGGAHARLLPPDALVCQPGTHSKWVRLDHGRIADFATSLTGELFALLRSHSILAPLLQSRIEPGRAFLEGVTVGFDGAFLRALFTERARAILENRQDAQAGERVSGLVIGRDLFEAGLGPGDVVHLLASGSLADLYRAALEEIGAVAVLIDCNAAFVCGVHALWRMTR